MVEEKLLRLLKLFSKVSENEVEADFAKQVILGMPSISNETCQEKVKNGDSSKTKFPGGCPCSTGADCLSGNCYLSAAPGPDIKQLRCATERIIGVTGTDISYNSFHSDKIPFKY